MEHILDMAKNLCLYLKVSTPLSVDYDTAIVYIKEKEIADAPIYNYQGLDVVKGKGRFGPFIKWKQYVY